MLTDFIEIHNDFMPILTAYGQMLANLECVNVI